MANVTTNLNLTLPGLGEFTNSWNIPLNANFTSIDTWAGAIQLEITNARFSKSSLKGFLEVAHNSDGTLKATQEIINARNSYLYGFDHGPTEDDQLAGLSQTRDLETWKARAVSPSLRDALAYRSSLTPCKILNGSKNANSYPTWAGFTGAKVQIDGFVTPLILEIYGQICRVRTLKEVTISGGAGTYYIYADFQNDGVSTFSSGSGAAGEDDLGNVRWHQDFGKNFTTEDVKVGDVLRYSSAPLAGDYLIDEVAPNGNNDILQIKSLFAASGSSIAYQIRDPLAVILGFAASETAAAGRGFIAEVDFDGVAVTAVRPRHFGDTFIGEWRAVDVSGGAPTFEEIWNHNLGTDKLEITIQASIANDGSQPVETLDMARISNTLGITTGLGTMAVGVGSLVVSTALGTVAVSTNTAPPDVHTHGLVGTPSSTVSGTPSLSGVPAATLTGGVVPYSAVAAKYTRSRVWVKNVVSAAFFRDYSGVDRQTGYIRVIISKKG